MNVLLIGSGGREHALAWKIAASPLVGRLVCAPGNAGIAQECELAALDPADHAAVIAFCRARAIDFVVVGPETPLCAGIVDDLAAAGIKAFGPSRAAAFDGPNALMPAAVRSSTMPAQSGASGPTTTRSIVRARQNAITAAWSAMSSATSSASCAMPALPGAQ